MNLFSIVRGVELVARGVGAVAEVVGNIARDVGEQNEAKRRREAEQARARAEMSRRQTAAANAAGPPCAVPQPEGWRCTRMRHEGPCALEPTEENACALCSRRGEFIVYHHDDYPCPALAGHAPA